MKKLTKPLWLTLLSLVFASFPGNALKAQKYYHGVGVNVDQQYYELEYRARGTEFEITSKLFLPGIFYKSTLALTDRFAISAYPFVGVYFASNSPTLALGTIGLQIPIIAEYYFAGSIEGQCYFGGLGMTYSFIIDEGDPMGHGTVVGPQLSIGGQFDLGGRIVGLRGGLAYALNRFNFSEPVHDVQVDKRYLVTAGVYFPLLQRM